jgi:hypothetical protein
MEDDLLYAAIIPVFAVFATGVISFFTMRWQVKKENKNTLRQQEEQYKNVVRQMREETSVLKYRKLNAQKLEALQRCWGLLVYSTGQENDKSILTYSEIQRRENRATIAERTDYFFSKKRIDEFLNALQQLYFVDGWGLYLSDELKNLLFEYRSKLFGLKLKEKRKESESAGESAGESESAGDIVRFKNTYIAKELLALHDRIAAALQKEMLVYFDIETQAHALSNRT